MSVNQLNKFYYNIANKMSKSSEIPSFGAKVQSNPATSTPKNEEEVKEQEEKRSKEQRKKSLRFVLGYGTKEGWWILLGALLNSAG